DADGFRMRVLADLPDECLAIFLRLPVLGFDESPLRELGVELGLVLNFLQRARPARGVRFILALWQVDGLCVHVQLCCFKKSWPRINTDYTDLTSNRLELIESESVSIRVNPWRNYFGRRSTMRLALPSERSIPAGAASRTVAVTPTYALMLCSSLPAHIACVSAPPPARS